MTSRLRIAAWILALGLAGPAAAGMPEDMASFERVFIPALALTNQPKAAAPRVEAAMRRLADAWPGFKPRLAAGGAPMDGPLLDVERAIGDAQALLASARRAQAHDALEQVRAALMQARAQLGIELYVDRLTEFHDAMEDFVKLAMSGAELSALRPPLEKTAALWAPAERMRFAPPLFGFDDDRFEQVAALVRRERAILRSLEADLAAGHRERVTEGAKQLKSVFAQIYVSFGDFSGL